MDFVHTIIAGHVHRHHLNQSMTLKQLSQQQLRQTEQQQQIRIAVRWQRLRRHRKSG